MATGTAASVLALVETGAADATVAGGELRRDRADDGETESGEAGVVREMPGATLEPLCAVGCATVSGLGEKMGL